MRLVENVCTILKEGYVCDSCLGRTIGAMLHGLSNRERGKAIRTFLAFLLESGERLEVDPSNFYGFKFRYAKLEVKQKECWICGNFFLEQLSKLAEKILKKIQGFEFESFLIGSKPTQSMLAAEEKVFEKIGIEFVESIREEINRELGKIVEEKTGKRFESKNPDLTIVVDLETQAIQLQIKSLFVFGKYKKLVRGIPQAKWVCSLCRGKGCLRCKGKGKLYPTSVQEIIEKPLLKASGSKKSSFHSAGREDIDARCLAWRSFVLELKKPLRRSFSLEKIREQINRSKKVKVSRLKLVGKESVRQVKSERHEKTYLVEVSFAKKLEPAKLKLLRQLSNCVVEQQTPTRVLHRRAAKLRKRLVRKVEWKVLGTKKLQLKLRTQAGLYVKELVSGDEGRTKPSIASLLKNEPRKILVDVIKIHEHG